MSSRQIGSKTGRFGAIPKIRTVSDDVSHHKKTWHIKIPTDSDDLGLGHFGCLTVNLQPAAPAGLSSNFRSDLEGSGGKLVKEYF